MGTTQTSTEQLPRCGRQRNPHCELRRADPDGHVRERWSHLESLLGRRLDFGPTQSRQSGSRTPIHAGAELRRGKLAAVWYDQRLDGTIGRMVCTMAPCQSMLNFDEIRVPTENFVAGHPEFVFNAFLADAPVSFKDNVRQRFEGQSRPRARPANGLARRHTIDVFGATAPPGDAPVFLSARVSQYLFGDLKGTPQNPDLACPPKGICAEQQQQSPVNVPIAAGGTRAFIGDYLDVAVQTIVPTPPVAVNGPAIYKFNCGNDSGTCANTNTQPVFHPAWTDNRDVVRPFDGDWTHHTPVYVIGVAQNGSTVALNNASCSPARTARAIRICTPRHLPGARADSRTPIQRAGFEQCARLRGGRAEPRRPRPARHGLSRVSPHDPAFQRDRELRSAAGRSGNARHDGIPAAPVVVVAHRLGAVVVASAAITVDISLIVNATGQPVTTAVKVSDLGLYAFQPVSQVALNSDPLATLNLNADNNTADSLYSTLNNAAQQQHAQ